MSGNFTLGKVQKCQYRFFANAKMGCPLHLPHISVIKGVPQLLTLVKYIDMHPLIPVYFIPSKFGYTFSFSGVKELYGDNNLIKRLFTIFT